MRSHRVKTDRLTMQLVESGPEDGIPVVLIHGNLSTGRFYEHLFDDAPERYRLLAPDMRGFGDTEPVPIDATRGLRDWADDTAALLSALGISAPPHLVGWSTGGAAIAAFALERPVASLTFIDPVGPYGYGGVGGATARRTSPTSPARAAGPATRSSPSACGPATGPPTATWRRATCMNSSYWRVGHRESPEREELLLGEILKSVTGDDGYPGDATLRDWPGVAPGTRGILNALSPKYCNWAGSWTSTQAADPVDARRAGLVVADGSPWEMGTLGSLGLVPAGRRRSRRSRWSRRSASCSSATTAASRSRSSRSPGTSRRSTRASAGPRGSSASWSRCRDPRAGLVDHELQSRSTTRPDGERITVFAREVAEPEGREAVPGLLPGRAGVRGVPAGRQPARPGFLDRALKDFRWLLLDQRGTGARRRSTAESAAYLKHFRADSIVRDAELLREALGVERWSILGQSFGGFCSFAYLSLAPDSLREALITGGTPPIGRPVDDVYTRHLGADGRAQPALLRALPGGSRADAGARRAAGGRGRAAARAATA